MKKDNKQTLLVAGAFLLLLTFSILIHYVPLLNKGPVNNEKISAAQEGNKSMQATVVQVGPQSRSEKLILDIVLRIIGVTFLVLIIYQSKKS